MHTNDPPEYEETLNLVCMKVHRNQTVDTCNREQVGHQLGADGNTGFVFSVLTCPTEVRDNGYNAFADALLAASTISRSSTSCQN